MADPRADRNRACEPEAAERLTRSNTPAAFEADKPAQKNALKSVTFGEQFSLTIIDRPKRGGNIHVAEGCFPVAFDISPQPLKAPPFKDLGCAALPALGTYLDGLYLAARDMVHPQLVCSERI
jgi:hypothetical protein